MTTRAWRLLPLCATNAIARPICSAISGVMGWTFATPRTPSVPNRLRPPFGAAWGVVLVRLLFVIVPSSSPGAEFLTNESARSERLGLSLIHHHGPATSTKWTARRGVRAVGCAARRHERDAVRAQRLRLRRVAA